MRKSPTDVTLQEKPMANVEQDEFLNHEEVSKQIQEISFALEASNRFLLSGNILVSYGVGILFIPVVELATHYLTFGLYNRHDKPLIFSVTQALTMFALFWFARVMVSRVFKEDHILTVHPVLKRALTFYRPLTLALAGTIIVFIPRGEENILYPVIFIYFGIVFSILGSFAGKRIVRVAWSLIVVGLIFAAVSPYIQPTIWMYFNTYLGLAFIYMGYFQLKEKRS